MFWLGIIATLGIEFIALIVAAVVKYSKQQKNLKVVDRRETRNML